LHAGSWNDTPNWGGGDSPDSMKAQADEAYDSFAEDPPPDLLSNDETEPPAYSHSPSTPPPIRPQSPNKRRTPPRPPVGANVTSIESLMEVANEPTRLIDLPDDNDDNQAKEMEETNNRHSLLGNIPGGPASGIDEAATGNYANSINLSDIEEDETPDDDDDDVKKSPKNQSLDLK
jgi:hypothetical protein